MQQALLHATPISGSLSSFDKNSHFLPYSSSWGKILLHAYKSVNTFQADKRLLTTTNKLSLKSVRVKT